MQLVEEIRNSNVKFLLIGLFKVEIINITGLGLLVASYISLKKNDIYLILINTPEKIFKFLEITHLLQIFTRRFARCSCNKSLTEVPLSLIISIN